MKKFLSLVILLFFIFQLSHAQVAINNNNAAANNSAMLDVTSTSKGVLIPRMTTAQRTAIASPAKGLMVFDSTATSLWYYDGTAWGELSAVNGNLWKLNGNNIYNTNIANVGIGTNTPDATALLHVNLGSSVNKGLLVTGNYNDLSTVPSLGAGTRMMFYPGKGAFRAGTVFATEWDNGNVGSYSAAMGYNTKAIMDYSFAMGLETKASGNASTALGRFTIASGANSTAMGDETVASGDYNSTAMGTKTIASGRYTTAMGGYTSAKGDASTSLGLGTIAKGFGTTAIGLWNDSILIINETGVPTQSTPLFIIGNGNDVSARSNAMVVRKDGKVGIGTSVPNTQFHLDNSLNVGPQITLSAPSGGTPGIVFRPYQTAAQWNNPPQALITATDNNSSANINFFTKIPGLLQNGLAQRMTIQNDGNVGIGTPNPQQALEVNGRIRQQTYSQAFTLAGNSGTFFAWNHNLGYQPVIMISLDQTGGAFCDYVSFAYAHNSANSLNILLTNRQANTATGTVRWIVVY